MISKELTEFFKNDQIKSGDLLLLHSDVLRTAVYFLKQKIKITSKDILNVFMSMVGKDGALLIPTFYFDFCKGKSFDIRNSKSQMGSLTEEARSHPNFSRTKHPIYSFCVYGKYKDDFLSLNNKESFGNDSPFAKLLELDGKIAVLNLPDQNSMTFYHFVEQQLRVDYRFSKDFTAKYIDENGIEEVRTYSMYVRDIEKNVQTSLEKIEEHMWSKNIYKGNRYNKGNGLRTCSTKDLYKETQNIIESGKAKGLLYKTN